jgi:AAA domain/CHC2 zinc finger
MLDKTIIDEARMIRIEDELARRGLPFWTKPRHDNLGQPCPMCGGTDRFSVSIKKQVFNCRECGAAGDVISLVQALDGTDFETAVATLAGPVPPFKPNGGRAPALKQVIAMRFDYEDEVGKLLYQIERIEFQNQDGSFVLGGAGKRDKIFLPRRPNESGGWITGKGCLDGVRRVPYRLPELIEALANGSMIVIVEGEAKVDLLRGWNIPATCNVGGSGNSKIWKEHARFLFKPGADVVVLPDNDEAGAAVRVLELPALPPNGDVINWAAAGGTADELHALIASHARPYAPADDGAADSLRAKVESNTNPIKLLSYAEMVSLPSTDWLIEGLVPRRSKSVAFGQSDTFKSFLATDMACSVSTGHTWHGKPVKRCKAIYLANEGAIGVGRKRIPAWMAYHDVSPEDRQNIFLVKVEMILPNPVSLANLIAAIRTIVEPGEEFFSNRRCPARDNERLRIR